MYTHVFDKPKDVCSLLRNSLGSPRTIFWRVARSHFRSLSVVQSLFLFFCLSGCHISVPPAYGKAFGTTFATGVFH